MRLEGSAREGEAAEGAGLETLMRFEAPVEKRGGEEEGNSLERIKERLLDSAGRDGAPELDTLLNIVVTPREWVEDGRTFVQYVSHHPSSREDVLELQKRLEERLSARQAKTRGICPIREELYAQCFDELIRQVTVECPERGLLLMRVRDELRMTIAAYTTLYKSAVAFGLRKQMEAQKGLPELEQQLGTLREEKERLEELKADLLERKAAAARQAEVQRLAEQKERKQEIDFLEYQNANLRTFLQSLDTAAKGG